MFLVLCILHPLSIASNLISDVCSSFDIQQDCGNKSDDSTNNSLVYEASFVHVQGVENELNMGK